MMHIIIPNIWYKNLLRLLQREEWLISGRKMTHDENVYSDPTTFNPDRFIGTELDPVDIVFGFGRYVVTTYQLDQ